MISISFNTVFEETNVALGNHLFQYCICRIIATKNNYNFFIPYTGKLPSFFPNLNFGVEDGQIKNNFIEDMNNQTFNKSLFEIDDFTHLNGFFQSEKYFEGYESEIKKWFDIEPISSIDDNLCIIQIRGGDNRISPIAQQLKWVLPKNYYLDGIKKIKELNQSAIFKIITDDPELSSLYFPDIEIITNNTIDDFKILISAKYSIISASTFAWWGRWLSDNFTVAPNNWLNYNNPHLGYYPQDIKSKKFTYI